MLLTKIQWSPGIRVYERVCAFTYKHYVIKNFYGLCYVIVVSIPTITVQRYIIVSISGSPQLWMNLPYERLTPIVLSVFPYEPSVQFKSVYPDTFDQMCFSPGCCRSNLFILGHKLFGTNLFKKIHPSVNNLSLREN